jgi:hypothetical protein
MMLSLTKGRVHPGASGAFALAAKTSPNVTSMMLNIATPYL